MELDRRFDLIKLTVRLDEETKFASPQHVLIAYLIIIQKNF